MKKWEQKPKGVYTPSWQVQFMASIGISRSWWSMSFFSCSSGHSLTIFAVWQRRGYCHPGVPLPWCVYLVWRGGWVGGLWQLESRFPSRTLQCNKMIVVNQLTCFNVVVNLCIFRLYLTTQGFSPGHNCESSVIPLPLSPVLWDQLWFHRQGDGVDTRWTGIKRMVREPKLSLAVLCVSVTV